MTEQNVPGVVPGKPIEAAVQNVDVRAEKNVQLTREVGGERILNPYEYAFIVENKDVLEGTIMATSDSNARDLAIAMNAKAVLSGDYRLLMRSFT